MFPGQTVHYYPFQGGVQGCFVIVALGVAEEAVSGNGDQGGLRVYNISGVIEPILVDLRWQYVKLLGRRLF